MDSGSPYSIRTVSLRRSYSHARWLQRDTHLIDFQDGLVNRRHGESDNVPRKGCEGLPIACRRARRGIHCRKEPVLCSRDCCVWCVLNTGRAGQCLQNENKEMPSNCLHIPVEKELQKVWKNTRTTAAVVSKRTPQTVRRVIQVLSLVMYFEVIKE